MAGFDYYGKTVWVTGAGKGIGYATALAFVEAGAQVTGFDREFTLQNYPFVTEVMDVADAGQVAEVCQRLLVQNRPAGRAGECCRDFTHGRDRRAESARLAADVCS